MILLVTFCCAFWACLFWTVPFLTRTFLLLSSFFLSVCACWCAEPLSPFKLSFKISPTSLYTGHLSCQDYKVPDETTWKQEGFILGPEWGSSRWGRVVQGVSRMEAQEGEVTTLWLVLCLSEPLADECADCVGSPPFGHFSGHTGTGILEQWLCGCPSVHHLSAVPVEARRGIRSSGGINRWLWAVNVGTENLTPGKCA